MTIDRRIDQSRMADKAILPKHLQLDALGYQFLPQFTTSVADGSYIQVMATDIYVPSERLFADISLNFHISHDVDHADWGLYLGITEGVSSGTVRAPITLNLDKNTEMFLASSYWYFYSATSRLYLDINNIHTGWHQVQVYAANFTTGTLYVGAYYAGLTRDHWTCVMMGY